MLWVSVGTGLVLSFIFAELSVWQQVGLLFQGILQVS
jgi:hypothetical protein